MKPKLIMVIIGILEIVIRSGMFDFVASECQFESSFSCSKNLAFIMRKLTIL